MVLIDSIQFNWDPQSARQSALNIRRNATESIALPEWRRGESNQPEDSPAAYALSQTIGRRIQIKARFTREVSAIQSVEIRAVEALRQPLPGRPVFLPHPQQIWPESYIFSSWAEYFYFVLYSAYYLWWQSSLAPVGNVLGEVKPRRVAFQADGKSGQVTFELENVRLASRGVSLNDIAWLWQYRIGAGDPWKSIVVTRHRIYSVLDVPTAPWLQEPFVAANTQLPWTEVLELACRWAAGAQTRAGMGRAVTEAVYGLGNGLIEYGCSIGAFPMYSNILGVRIFDCSAFIERVRGGVGNGPFVNCSDCATFVSTFANILGYDLWQSIMGRITVPFETNPIQTIGSAEVQSPCGWGLGFTFHEVAWTGACRANDRVFDACLRVLASPLSGLWPPVMLLPTDMRFGFSDDGQYLDRLAAPLSRINCIPQPEVRIRRAVF